MTIISIQLSEEFKKEYSALERSINNLTDNERKHIIKEMEELGYPTFIRYKIDFKDDHWEITVAD